MRKRTSAFWAEVLSLSKNPDSGTRIGVKNSSETKIEIKAGKNEEQTEVSIRTPSPDGEFFEVHGSKFKPDPIGNLGKAS